MAFWRRRRHEDIHFCLLLLGVARLHVGTSEAGLVPATDKVSEALVAKKIRVCIGGAGRLASPLPIPYNAMKTSIWTLLPGTELGDFVGNARQGCLSQAPLTPYRSPVTIGDK